MVRVYKVAVIGCGRIAGHNCRAVVSTEGLELAAVCDLEIEKANIYRDEFGVPAFKNYHTMLTEIRDIDKVAFIRFASVYRQFKDIGEFQAQIEDLKE
jgi:UDP-N-acetyl-2-amino-2-deoxyglucuronate dehydrogenase